MCPVANNPAPSARIVQSGAGILSPNADNLHPGAAIRRYSFVLVHLGADSVDTTSLLLNYGSIRQNLVQQIQKARRFLVHQKAEKLRSSEFVNL
jgi:hypothetical protein